MTPRDFHLPRFIKDYVYVPPIPANLLDITKGIKSAVATITSGTLIKALDELNLMCALCLMVLTLNT